MRALCTALLVAAGPLAADSADHLLLGAGAFREGRFAAALVEFRVAQRLGSSEAAWYAGAALQKLGRPEEALEAFAAAGPGPHDALLDYYRALACFDARLYLCADRLLASVGDRSGPRIAGLVRETRVQIAQALQGPPSTGAIDWYHLRAKEAVFRGRTQLGLAYLEEAQALAQRRPDQYRLREAEAALGRLRSAERQP
jgi:hypothetical protein